MSTEPLRWIRDILVCLFTLMFGACIYAGAGTYGFLRDQLQDLRATKIYQEVKDGFQKASTEAETEFENQKREEQWRKYLGQEKSRSK